MATQEERLATVERGLASFQRETVQKIHETNENGAILLGLVYKQNIEIKSIHERLDAMDTRLDTMYNRLDAVDQRLGTLEQDVREVKTTQKEHTALLTQILERLPK